MITMKKMRNEQYLEMKNYKDSLIRNFIIFWQIVCFICIFLFFCVLVYPEFWLCDYYNREMKKCQCYWIYEKANDM